MIYQRNRLPTRIYPREEWIDRIRIYLRQIGRIRICPRIGLGLIEHCPSPSVYQQIDLRQSPGALSESPCWNRGLRQQGVPIHCTITVELVSI